MKTTYDVEELMKKYMERHDLKIKFWRWDGNTLLVDTQCWKFLELKLHDSGRVTFKCDFERSSIYK